MPILVEDFPTLTDELDSIFSETARRKVADSVGLKVFNVFETDKLTYDHLVLHGVEGIKRLTSGQDLPRVSAEEGDSISWTQEYFGAIVSVTKKMRRFDLTNQIKGLPKTLADDAFNKVDQSLADVLLNGWSTSYTDVYGDTVASVGPDGLALFSSAHTNGLTSATYSNIISDGTNTNPPLSRQAITYQRAQGWKHTDPNSINRKINYDVVVVGPELYDEAVRICESEYLPGTNNNDKNPLYGKVKVIMWERLAISSGGTDCDAYWFMYDSTGVNESLQCLFAERPTLDAPDEVYVNKNWDYSCDFFYVIGIGYQAYVAGSKGDKS